MSYGATVNRLQNVASEDSAHTALFVSGSPEGVSADVLRALAQECSFILAVDSGANQLLAADITPDLLLGDLDSIDPSVLTQYQERGIATESFDAYKNSTDVELGIEALVARGYKRMIATNVLGGRTDHALGSLGALASAALHHNMEVRLRDEHEACYFVSSGEGDRALELDFSPLLPRHISLVAWGSTMIVSITGTEWELDHYALSPNSARGISNVAISSKINLVVHEGNGVVLVLLTLGQ